MPLDLLRPIARTCAHQEKLDRLIVSLRNQKVHFWSIARLGTRLRSSTTLLKDMGALISRLWFFWFPAKEYKIVVVGLDNAGKSDN